jgi:hypothetical protein
MYVESHTCNLGLRCVHTCARARARTHTHAHTQTFKRKLKWSELTHECTYKFSDFGMVRMHRHLHFLPFMG